MSKRIILSWRAVVIVIAALGMFAQPPRKIVGDVHIDAKEIAMTAQTVKRHVCGIDGKADHTRLLHARPRLIDRLGKNSNDFREQQQATRNAE